MLVIVTGTRQVGKTRWLEHFIESATQSGLRCVGLISPGIWIDAANGELKKTGISARLLPEGEEFTCALRRDLAPDNPDQFSQADKAQLGWRVYDDAIERVNAHFDALRAQGLLPRDILVVDEIGTLELVHGGGFTSALGMLDDPTFAAPEENGSPEPNAVIIMRPELLQETKERLAPIWGEPLVIDASCDDAYRGIESLIRSFSSASVRS